NDVRIAQRVVDVDGYGERAADRSGGVQVEIGVEVSGGFRGAIGADRHDDVADRVGRVHRAGDRIQGPALHPLTGRRDQNSVLVDAEISGAREESRGGIGGGGDW